MARHSEGMAFLVQPAAAASQAIHRANVIWRRTLGVCEKSVVPNGSHSFADDAARAPPTFLRRKHLLTNAPHPARSTIRGVGSTDPHRPQSSSLATVFEEETDTMRSVLVVALCCQAVLSVPLPVPLEEEFNLPGFSAKQENHGEIPSYYNLFLY